MTYTIKNRWSAAALWTGESADLRDAVQQAVSAHAYLRDADLRDANLRGADLGDADLRGADLGGADLSGADLGGADLGGAYLSGADLGGADLGGADLRDANLRDANLRGADLRGADLRDANLRGADMGGADLGDAYLRDADLQMIRDDVWAVLSSAPTEASAVLEALRAGRVNGSTYSGACACLVGTIANARGCSYDDLPTLRPNSLRPAEQWFLQISEGDTPETHEPTRLAAEWVSEWLANMRAAFGGKDAA